MMKKALLIGVIACAPVGSVLADNNIGCGWGTQIWKGKSGLLPKILGSTTNGVLGNQTFGITSGTSGCSADGVITASARLKQFAGHNLDQIAQDVARGSGESLEQMAIIYGVESADRQRFYELAKANFSAIFTADTTAQDVVEGFNRMMAADAQLAGYAV